jgi:hypothetical protein
MGVILVLSYHHFTPPDGWKWGETRPRHEVQEQAREVEFEEEARRKPVSTFRRTAPSVGAAGDRRPHDELATVLHSFATP